ncbi:MAG: hypothetical protein HC866_17965 [Leptolyngbyaceae cyanobacterium RU_5_1]|nr:hypothetical protein [Leptolyngbyaceae cyanobacterium RU_5_1]
MSDSSPLSSDAIKETTEKVATFVKWIAELIRSRNWFTLLLLVDVALILFLTPGGIVAKFLKDMFSLELPPQYASGFWLVVGLVFVVALGVAVRTMPAAAKAADTKERKAIKGLRPFTAADAEIFAQLQRNRDVQICLDAVTSADFRFGILMGESGCGKTSFLQAGMIPRLSLPDCSHRGVYVRFSDRAPLDTIRAALAEQVEGVRGGGEVGR